MDGLVAHYDFNEGSGTTLHDLSGNGNDGTIQGAQYIKRSQGYCLEFNGIDDYVDCGSGPSLDLQDSVTLEAWVLPMAPPAQYPYEAGIAGKHTNSYILTLYKNHFYWYGRGTNIPNNIKSQVSLGSWHHVVGTFDGTQLNLYLDGASVASFFSTQPYQLSGGNKFFIGCLIGAAGAGEPSKTPDTVYFQGLIDEVKVYNRALSSTEIQQHFDIGLSALQTAEYQPNTSTLQILHDGVVISVGPQGQVQIEVGGELYLVESAYSFPGSVIGWNHLTSTIRKSELNWNPELHKISSTTIEIKARGAFYQLNRLVEILAGRIQFEDRLTNVGSEPAGLIVWNQLTGPNVFVDAPTPQTAENPIIYLATGPSVLGVLVQDNISRLQFDPSVGLPGNQARFRVANFVLDVCKAYTMRWSIYHLSQPSDYFDMVNRIRRVLHSNFTIQGAFTFLDIGSPLFTDSDPQHAKLKEYLDWKGPGLVGLIPWLDYDPRAYFETVLTRPLYAQLMKQAVGAIKAVAPGIACLGCIETDWVAINSTEIPSGCQTKSIPSGNLDWRYSVKIDDYGNIGVEHYTSNTEPQGSLSVFPAVGNHQYDFLLGQVKFLLEDVGLDGFYIDQFSQADRAQPMNERSYIGWDGYSADVDPSTGRIEAYYIDCSLAGLTARLSVCKYALHRGKIVVANTYASTEEEQSLPVFRFAETWGEFRLSPNTPLGEYVSNDATDGTEPPLDTEVLKGNLASPIGLGVIATAGSPQVPLITAKRLMKALVAYLRHGMLYYHYQIEDIPIGGPGDYGPIKHMFPITPIALHMGWIEGNERIITAISGTYSWKHATKPVVRRFDLTGIELSGTVTTFQYHPVTQTWEVSIQMDNWKNIVVIEN
jgi:hypothetical protein